MNSKEIIKYLKNSIDEKGNYCYSLPIETTRKTIKCIKEKDKEIERLKEDISVFKFTIKIQQEQIQELIAREDKAIEYIEEHQLNFKKGTTTFGSERLSMEERKLLDILKGVDKE